MKWRTRWWAGLAALPLIYLPLAAQETAEQKPAAAAETPAPAADTPATGSVTRPAAAPVDEDPPTEAELAEEVEAAPLERVSADNNLSFPVDI